MTTPTQGEHAQTEALRPKFGDLLRNTMASESNPRRDAYFIREVLRSGGGVNPGRWFEMTDGKGETWLSNPQNLVPAATPGEHAQTALAHELFAAAQLAPGEGIEDAVNRIAAALTAAQEVPKCEFLAHGCDTPSYCQSVQRCTARDEKRAAPAQPAAPQGVAHAELPEPIWRTAQGIAFSERQLYDFADRTHALRASHGQAPAVAYKDSTPGLHVGDSSFESWYSGYKLDPTSIKQIARDAYAAGMGDPLVTYAPTAQAAPAGDLPEEQTQPWYDLAWRHGARRHTSFDGDELTELSFSPTQFDAFCADLATAAGAVAHTLSDAQIEAMPVWRNFVGLWPESRREIVDAVLDLLAAAPTPAAQADSAPSPVLDYPPLPDLISSVWPFIHTNAAADSAAMVAKTSDQVDAAIHTLLRAYVDADRAARKQGGA